MSFPFFSRGGKEKKKKIAGKIMFPCFEAVVEKERERERRLLPCRLRRRGRRNIYYFLALSSPRPPAHRIYLSNFSASRFIFPLSLSLSRRRPWYFLSSTSFESDTRLGIPCVLVSDFLTPQSLIPTLISSSAVLTLFETGYLIKIGQSHPDVISLQQ